jgi:hypothetical protein
VYVSTHGDVQDSEFWFLYKTYKETRLFCTKETNSSVRNDDICTKITSIFFYISWYLFVVHMACILRELHIKDIVYKKKNHSNNICCITTFAKNTRDKNKDIYAEPDSVQVLHISENNLSIGYRLYTEF